MPTLQEMNHMEMANGAVVLDYRRVMGDSMGESGIALCRFRGAHPYVTWVIGKNKDESTWCAISGHYFATISEAVEDFTSR